MAFTTPFTWSAGMIPTATQLQTLNDGIAWATGPRQASPPASPSNGDEWYLVADATAGVVWRFKYNSGSGSTYKWEFVGGPPLFVEVTTSEATATTGSYQALATAGPAVTLTRAGDYEVAIGFDQPGIGGTDDRAMSYDIGGTGALDADAVRTTRGGDYSRFRVKTGLTAVTLTAKYKSTTTNGTYANRWMRVLPVRVI